MFYEEKENSKETVTTETPVVKDSENKVGNVNTYGDIHSSGGRGGRRNCFLVFKQLFHNYPEKYENGRCITNAFKKINTSFNIKDYVLMYRLDSMLLLKAMK